MFLTFKTLVFSIMAEGYVAGDIVCAHAWAEQKGYRLLLALMSKYRILMVLYIH